MQGRKLLLTVLSSITACVMASPALSLELSAPDGWYAEANAGISHVSNTNFNISANNGLSYNVNVGYKIMPYLGIEAGYTWYKESKFTFEGFTIADISHYSFDAALKGMLPVGCGVEFFGKLGASHIRSKATLANDVLIDIVGKISDSSDATGVFVGLGGQINIMPEMSIDLQWQRATGNKNTGNIDLFSIGIAFIFV